MLTRKFFRISILIGCLFLISNLDISAQRDHLPKKSAAALFPFHQFLRMQGARTAPLGFIYEKSRVGMSWETLHSIPDSFSWLDKGIMTSVKIQGTCGSCWAFAAVGMVEALIKRSDGIDVDLSEQHLVNCVPETSGCDGGFGWYAHLYMVNNGIVRESVYPYQNRDWDCDVSAPSEYFLTKAWLYMRDGTETKAERREKIKHIIRTYGPVDTVLALFENFYNYESGVYIYDGISPQITFHGGVIVGWIDDPTIPTGGYWIVKNDWGPAWGENGYYRIAYDPEEYNIIEFDIRYGLYNGLANDPPYFDGLEDTYQVREGQEFTISNYAKDPEEDALLYSAQNLPSWMTINPATGTISGKPDFTQSGKHTVTISISDWEYSFHRLVTFDIKNVKKIIR
ncbi:C1 family peptidase [Acidobacteriota bacterium]